MDLNNICRACLSKRGRMQNITSAKNRAMIESCSSILILETDNLPKKICDNCFRRLVNSYSFNNMIQRSDKILRNFLHSKTDGITDFKTQNNLLQIGKIQSTSKKCLNSEPPPLVPIAEKRNDTTKNTCTICHETFKNTSQLLSHLPSHVKLTPSTLPLIKRHKCPMCEKHYNNRNSLRLHLYNHTGERPHQCPICAKQFVRWAGVTSHMVTHSGQRAHACPVCGRGFKVRSNMERHKALHTGISPFCCNFCGKTFTQSNNLTLHMQTHHTMERLYLCNICGKQFVSSSRLNRHIRIHNRTTKFEKSIDCDNSSSIF